MVAVKEIPMDGRMKEEFVMHKVETLRKRAHPKIVPLLSSYTIEVTESGYDTKKIHLVLPWADHGNLERWMESPKPPAFLGEIGLVEKDRRVYILRAMYELVSALASLHREKDSTITSHHDLKPKNILVFGKGLKLADFGCSHIRSVAENSETGESRALGTYAYQPPEYWDNNGFRAHRKHGRAFDMWAMGCIIVEMATLVVFGWEAKMINQFKTECCKNLAVN